MPGKVAAIHRRDVARIQRAQVLCVVPVVKMTSILLQATQRREGRLQPLNGLEGADPSEVTSTDRGEQIQAEIGGGGSMCQDRSWIFLEVIGRQHMVVCRDKCLEVAPGAAGNQPQSLGVSRRDRQATRDERGKADPY